MDADLAAYLDWLDGSGVVCAPAPDLARDPDHDEPLVAGAEPTRTFRWPGLPPIVEHRDPAAGLAADHATDAVTRVLLRYPPRGVAWDIGVGTGILAVVAALTGASSVVATDVNETVLALARRTIDDAGVQVDLGCGSLLDPIPADARADFVIANLPHKPVPADWKLLIAQNGGVDGAAIHAGFLEQALPRLAPGATVVFFLHSLPHPRLLRLYAEHLRLELCSWKRRFLQPGEYGGLQAHFRERADRGESFVGTEEGRPFLVAGVWRAVRP